MIRLLDLSGLYWATWMGNAGKPPSYTYERVIGRVAELSRDCALAICLDSQSNWRRELDPSYKANRPAKEAAAIEQLRRVVDELRALGYPLWQADGMEADDVIASACKSDDLAGYEIQIATSDKDLLALVDDRVRVLSLTRVDAQGAPVVVDEAAVLATFGVGPSQMRDLLALMGDKSDNVPGAKGVGQKHAARLLASHGGDLAGVLAAAQDDGAITPPSIEAAIRASLGDIDRSARLVTLRTDVVLPYTEVLQPRRPIERGDAHEGFADGGFEDSEPEPEKSRDEPPPPKSAPRASPAPAERRAVEPRPVARSAALTIAATTSPAYMLALEPSDLPSAYKLARCMFDSGLFSGRSGHVNVESIFATILVGRTMGIDAMTALRGIDIIKGKPRLSAQMLVGLVMRSGLAKYFQLVESTNERATYKTHRHGDPELVTMSYSIDEAKAACKLNEEGPWKTARRTMLRWRCCSELARAVYPDVAANVYTPGDFEEGVTDAQFEVAS